MIGEEVSGSFKVYHFDYRGSTVAITDSNCNITDTFTYDTYGKLTARTGTTKTPFLYNGRDGVMYEDDTGLIYMRARYYSHTLRQFVNTDKVHGDISNALTLNRYAFVNGNPASNVDPLRLSAERVGIGTAWGGKCAVNSSMPKINNNIKYVIINGVKWHMSADDGSQPSTINLIKRNIAFYFPPIELISFLIKGGKTIGDIISNTIVVEKKKD